MVNNHGFLVFVVTLRIGWLGTPDPNGRTLWLINGGDPNHLRTGMILQASVERPRTERTPRSPLQGYFFLKRVGLFFGGEQYKKGDGGKQLSKCRFFVVFAGVSEKKIGVRIPLQKKGWIQIHFG